MVRASRMARPDTEREVIARASPTSRVLLTPQRATRRIVAPVDAEDLGVPRLAQPGRVLDDGLEHRAEIRGRVTDQTEDRAGRRLLLQ